MDRLGFTLIEAIVAVVLVALLGSLAGTGLGAALQQRGPEGLDAEIDEARREAILSGAPREAIVDSVGSTALFLPDGRAIGAGYDPLTGLRTDR